MLELKIPRIIHQTWRTGDVPVEWKEFTESWKKCHPEWQYKLWTDEDNYKFVKECYPDFKKLFESYSYNIQRADVIRYLILYKYGGLYADLDFECLKPMENLLTGKSFIVGFESPGHAKMHGENSLICNAYIASIPHHPFLGEVLNTLKNINPKITFHREVLTTTGPLMINEVYKGYNKKDITVLDYNVLYPFDNNSKEIEILLNKKRDYLLLKKKSIRNGTFAIHYWSNSWIRELAGTLINPDPYEVEGFKFFPGWDSPGFDIVNVGRDIKKLVNECNSENKSVGFNTDGFLKSHIRIKKKWVVMNSSKRNEGLYIKEDYSLRIKLFFNEFRKFIHSTLKNVFNFFRSGIK